MSLSCHHGRYLIILVLFLIIFTTMRVSLLTGAASVPIAAAVSPVVHLNYTSYRGSAFSNGVTQWLGMRYAAPPLGDLRFREPENPPSQGGVIDANDFGPICLGTDAGPPTDDMDEDCLFLNVFAPSKAGKGAKLPVYFFIQGGGFNTNSNANYNGSGLIEASGGNIVVVNFNYR